MPKVNTNRSYAAAILIGIASSGFFAFDARASLPCIEKVFDVNLDAIGEAEIYTEICGLVEGTQSKPVQILLHGGSYDHRYWDSPFKPETYSYVQAAVEEGYVTVNLDRLGYGQSTRPNGLKLGFELGASAVSDVVDQIDAGALGVPISSIILNGHSMGGIVAEIVAGTNSNVDALIVSGLANSPEGQDEEEDGGPPPGGNPFILAKRDAKFKGLKRSFFYMTTAPDVRTRIFHAPETFEPEIARVEEDLRETLSVNELKSVMFGDEDGTKFTGPTVYFLGQFDLIACGEQDCSEKFEDGAEHEIIYGSGHSINFSLVATTFYQRSFDWLAYQGLDQ